MCLLICLYLPECIQRFEITEWITCGEGEGGSEAIEDIVLLLRLHKTYEVRVYDFFRRRPVLKSFQVPNDSSKNNSSSAPRSPRKRITKVTSTEKSNEKSDGSGDVDMDAVAQVTGTKDVSNSHRRLTNHVLERQVGDTYPPEKLSDHQGPYFAQDKTKLVQ